MASVASQAMVSANSCAFSSPKWHTNYRRKKQSRSLYGVRASSSSDDADCNAEECAPDKEVGKVSMEWVVGEKTKVLGTYPPRKRGWTGYIEKDTAGQTNIYSVEPAVYVAESAISSGTAGSSSDGAQNTAAIASGIALISIAAASSILLQVNKTQPQLQRSEYSGPALSYYINKFKPPETIIRASIPTSDSPPVVMPEASAEDVPPAQFKSGGELESSSSGMDIVS